MKLETQVDCMRMGAASGVSLAWERAMQEVTGDAAARAVARLGVCKKAISDYSMGFLQGMEEALAW